MKFYNTNSYWVLMLATVYIIASTAKRMPIISKSKEKLSISFKEGNNTRVQCNKNDFVNPSAPLCESGANLTDTRQAEAMLESFIILLKSFSTLTEVNWERFEEKIPSLMKEIRDIESKIQSKDFPGNTSNELSYAHRMFRIMLHSKEILGKFNFPGNAADALVYKIIQLKVIALSFQIPKGRVDSQPRIPLKDVNYLFHNVWFLRLVAEDMTAIPIDTRFILEDQATQAEEIIGELAIQIMDSMK